MAWQRYPNANYPEAYDEAEMVKATDVSVNDAGGLLTVTEAGAGFGPLLEGMEFVTAGSGDPTPTFTDEPEPESIVEDEPEAAE